MRARKGWWGRGAAVVAVLALAGCTGVQGGAPAEVDGKPSASAAGQGGDREAGKTLPGVPSVEEARKALAGLEVAAHGPMTGYDRDRFPHWAEQGESCDTRETVLERGGTGVKQDDECRAVSGSWTSVYDGESFTDASDLDIDHTVPLANAWRSGARSWPQEKRRDFANDLTHPQLLAVSAASNRSKGDQGPDEWQPPSRTYWCTYARSWTSVKAAYELTVTPAEKDRLDEMLGTCS